MKMRFWKAGAATAVAAAGLLSICSQEPANTANPPPADFDTNAEPKVVQPAQINLSPALAEVVRLAQSGSEESIVIAYIQKAPTYRISGDEIIYMKDLGISENVLKALVEHSQAAGSTPETQPSPAAPPTTPPLVPQPQPVASTPPAAVAEFYEPLTPYGTWIEVEPYGWCWQPSVVVLNAGWSPYCDNGYWLWSDSGWYWHSYYSWGWAPFHYGRWFYHPHRRWVWLPDRVWGPSWVCWRNSNRSCGWAPLPPGAYFSVGVGWRFRGRVVGPDFGFGLAAPHFTFVATAHFTDPHVAVRRLPPREVNVVFHNTTVINHYTVGSGNRIINQGVDRGRIESATGTRLREVVVRETPRERTHATMPDRVTKVGNSDVVYRPGPKIEVPRKPAPTAMGNREALTHREAPIHREGSIRGGEALPGTVARPATPTAKPQEQITPGIRQPPLRPGGRQPEAAPPSIQPRVTPPALQPQPKSRPPQQEERRDRSSASLGGGVSPSASIPTESGTRRNLPEVNSPAGSREPAPQVRTLPALVHQANRPEPPPPSLSAPRYSAPAPGYPSRPSGDLQSGSRNSHSEDRSRQ